MKYISLLLITLFFASCGNQKMRFVRTHNTKQKVVEISEIPTLKKSVESNSRTETRATEPEMISSEQQSERSTDLPSSENARVQEVDVETTFPIITEDSTKLTAAETLDITNKALRAEKLGSWSLALSIAIYVFLALAILVIVLSLLGSEPIAAIFAGVILMIASFASMVISFILGGLSLRSDYNTPQGRRRAIAGIVISSVMLFLLLVNVVLSL